MESIPIKNSLKLKMFCKTISRKQSIGQLLTQVPRRKSSTGNGGDFLLQPQAKPTQIAGQHELSSLAPSNGLLKKEAMKPRLISHMHQLSSMAHPALANTQYPPISPQNLEVHPAKKDDEKEKQEILELFLEQFMFDEPLSRCLKLNREETEPFFRAIVDTCTRDEPSVSLLVRDSTANNRLVGVLLNHLLARTENAPNLYENKNYSPNVALFCKIVHCCESHLWDLLPKNVNLVCNNVFMSVRRDYAKMGIGQQMVELSELNVQQMDGVQAGVGELTAIGTQKIYARCGYKPLLSIPYNMWMNERGKQIVEAANGFPIPESIQLVGKFYCFD